jgi:CheY-like chemotaxis protein
MPEGGKLTIETANVTLDEGYLAHHPDAQVGPHVMLAVSDTGIGMDEETQARIFEPFFTTKEEGKGTGLGLPTVYGIAKQSGGNIHVYSESGVGTTFRVYLPRVEKEAAPMPEHTATDEALKGSETILLVEDEELVRELMVEVLEGRGYELLAAANGAEALAICEQHEGRIDLMVTDVVMPGMSGVELAAQARQVKPDMEVLYLSGYTNSALVAHGALGAEGHFLEKPFEPDDLARKMREILDAPQQPQE